MPNISVKMLEGRTEEQKKRLAAALVRTLTEELHCSDHYVTCTIEDYSAVEWQKVFQKEIAEKPAGAVYKKAEYDPKSLL